MIFRNLPAIITLVAALIACIVTFIYRYDLTKALIIILVAAVVFFILGCMVRMLLNRFLNPEKEDSEGGGETEAAAEDDGENE